MQKPLTIVVGTNTLTEIQYQAYTNHCQFWFRLGRSYPHIKFIIVNPARMSIDRMRNMTAKAALECHADYVLFLDDDVIVNPNYGLQQLLDCDADIAAGKVCVRGYPFNYMVFCKTEENPDGLYIQSELPRTGIHECDAVGFSFALIKTSIIKRMQEPWFVTGTNNTEDVYFCKRIREIDPTVSIRYNAECECGHILWTEVISEQNREAYKYYMETVNPGLLSKVENKNGDRGEEYLNVVIRTIGALQNA